MTGAPMIGSLSACLQANAQGVAEAQCRIVGGGEKIALGDGVTMRVVRWNHSGDATNPIQHFARELYRPPVPDAATGGLRAGVGEDYPNGGGNRAFLFTVDSPEGQLSFFVNNSASGFDLDKDAIVDGVSFGSPLANLAAAMKDAGLTQVDAWLSTGGLPVAQQVVPILKPKVYLPNHWDGLFNPFWPGMPFPFKDDALRSYLEAQKIALMPQTQYFDKFDPEPRRRRARHQPRGQERARLRRRAALQPVAARCRRRGRVDPGRRRLRRRLRRAEPLGAGVRVARAGGRIRRDAALRTAVMRPFGP